MMIIFNIFTKYDELKIDQMSKYYHNKNHQTN